MSWFSLHCIPQIFLPILVLDPYHWLFSSSLKGGVFLPKFSLSIVCFSFLQAFNAFLKLPLPELVVIKKLLLLKFKLVVLWFLWEQGLCLTHFLDTFCLIYCKRHPVFFLISDFLIRYLLYAWNCWITYVLHGFLVISFECSHYNWWQLLF